MKEIPSFAITWHWKVLCRVKPASHRTTNTAGFHLHKVINIIELVEAEYKVVFVGGLWEGKERSVA